jgi:predicted RND superfamily exporter protein
MLAKTGLVRYEIPVRTHLRPELIRELGGLSAFIREHKQDAVGGVLGPEDYLTTTRFMLRPDHPEARVLSDDAGEIKTLWEYYTLAFGQERLRQIVDSNFCQSLTTVFLKDANFVGTARLMADIRDYERANLTPKGINLVFAGDVAVSQSLIHGIVTTQLQSLTWSLLGIFAVTSALGGSWRWGFYCLLPSLLAVLVKFAVMGWADIPLGVATSMFAAMTLGIGVNCTIHLLEGFSQARTGGKSAADALSQSLRLTGPPALINTLAVSLGFGVLMLSQVPANARLGLLLVLGLVNCFIAMLLLLPVLLHWWPLKDAGESASGAPATDSIH